MKVFETLSEPPAEFRKRAEIEESMDDGIQMSTLTITKSQLADRKVYICQVKSRSNNINIEINNEIPGEAGKGGDNCGLWSQ